MILGLYLRCGGYYSTGLVMGSSSEWLGGKPVVVLWNVMQSCVAVSDQLSQVVVWCFRNYLNYVVEELKDPYRYHVSLLLTVILFPLCPLCSFTSSSFALFLLFHFLSGFNYFLLLSIPFLSTRIVPLRFQARGRRKRPNLGLVCCV